MATVQSLMKMRLLTAPPDETVAVAVARMSELDLGAILVVEGGRLRGIFSERDLLRRVVAAGRDPERTLLAEVATAEPASVRADTSLGDCARLVRERGFRHLPVVDREGRPVGILSTRDFLQFVADGLEELIDRARSERALEQAIDPYELIGG